MWSAQPFLKSNKAQSPPREYAAMHPRQRTSVEREGQVGKRKLRGDDLCYLRNRF